VLTFDRALRLAGFPVVAFVGAGGKTTAMFCLGRALRSCVATTTTHLGDWQAALADAHVCWPETESDVPAAAGPRDGVVLVSGAVHPSERRVDGLSDQRVRVLRQWAQRHGRALLVEADGSRRLPLKAPAAHEPAMPSVADVVVSVVGLTALGRPLDEAHVHRPDRFSELTGCPRGAPVTAEHVAGMLLHADGGRKAIPRAARHVVLLNQADSHERRVAAARLAELVLPRVEAVIGARSLYAVHERVAGTVLAAGSSTRFGRPKQLLDYHGRPFVRAAAEAALKAGLDPVQVIVGDHGDAVAAALVGLAVTVIHNPGWREGQAASIRAGVGALPSGVGAAVFLLADQPQVAPALVRALVGAHAEGLSPFVAPAVGGTRANPVLFDRETFPELQSLSGDVGGRAVIAKHAVAAPGQAPVRLVPWPDARILIDVDTEDDYLRLLGARD
jgi:molybdenum cofactor cytidylyltransferase